MTPRREPRITLADVRLPLLLVGLPGAGKTTVARLLAAALGVQATDTDAEIRRRARMTIPEIFAAEGEEGFRTWETRALRAVLDSPAPAQGVVALGGGAILREQNRALLRGRTVVHLAASPETAAAHVGDGTGRPLVAPEADSDATAGALRTAQGVAHTGPRRHDRHGAVLARMEALHVQRAPLYAEVATLTVPVDGLTPQQVAALILVGLGAQAPSTARALADLTAPASAAGTRPRRLRGRSRWMRLMTWRNARGARREGLLKRSSSLSEMRSRADAADRADIAAPYFGAQSRAADPAASCVVISSSRGAL